MGEAKRRGTFEERRQQAQARRAAEYAAHGHAWQTPERERLVVVLPNRNMTHAAALMAIALMAGRRRSIGVRNAL